MYNQGIKKGMFEWQFSLLKYHERQTWPLKNTPIAVKNISQVARNSKSDLQFNEQGSFKCEYSFKQ